MIRKNIIVECIAFNGDNRNDAVTTVMMVWTPPSLCTFEVWHHNDGTQYYSDYNAAMDHFYSLCTELKEAA